MADPLVAVPALKWSAISKLSSAPGASAAGGGGGGGGTGSLSLSPATARVSLHDPYALSPPQPQSLSARGASDAVKSPDVKESHSSAVSPQPSVSGGAVFLTPNKSPRRNRNPQSSNRPRIGTVHASPNTVDPVSNASTHIQTASGGKRRDQITTSYVTLPRAGSPELRRKLERLRTTPGGAATSAVNTSVSPNLFAIESALLSRSYDTASKQQPMETVRSGGGHAKGAAPPPLAGSKSPARDSVAAGAGADGQSNSSIQTLSDWFDAELAKAHDPELSDSAADAIGIKACETAFAELLRFFAHSSVRAVSESGHLLSRVMSDWHRLRDRMSRRRTESSILEADSDAQSRITALTEKFKSQLTTERERYEKLSYDHRVLSEQNVDQSRALAHLHGRTDNELLTAQRTVMERDVSISKLNEQITVWENKYELVSKERAIAIEERAILFRERSLWHEQRDELISLVSGLKAAVHQMQTVAHTLSSAAAAGTGTGPAPPAASTGGEGGALPSDVIALLRRATIAVGGAYSSPPQPTGTDKPVKVEIFAMPHDVRTKAALRLQSWSRGHRVRSQPAIAQLRATHKQTRRRQAAILAAKQKAMEPPGVVSTGRTPRAGSQPPVLARKTSASRYGRRLWLKRFTGIRNDRSFTGRNSRWRCGSDGAVDRTAG